MSAYKNYLTNVVPELLKQLKTESEPSFGIMTAQHMVEHLIWVTKSSLKDYGPVPEALTDKQANFMKFVQNGANFEHRPSDKKREDLAPGRMKNLDEAIATIPEAIDRIYAHSGDHTFYNPLMGSLSFDEMELFHAKHFEYHLEKQFGLRI